MAIVEFLSNIIIDFITSSGYLGIFIWMLLESANIPIPSEIIMPFSGYLVYLGKFSMIGIIFVGALGNLVGSIISYYIGLKEGRSFIEKYGKYFLLGHKHIKLSEKWFKRYGTETIFFSRLLPIVRTFISLPAGIGKMNIKKFIIYTFIGSLIWSAILGYLGFILGPEWNNLVIFFNEIDIILIIIFILLILFWKFRK
ncbi:MAG: DedA family protein [Candidatus Aenigmatarchaeota archaeon]